MTEQSAPRLNRLVIATIAVIVLGVLAVIIAALNRGFDFGDEGFVLAMAASNRGSSGEFWGFQHLVHPIHQLFGGSILAFRVMRLLGYIALGLLLTVVAKKTLSALAISLSKTSWILIALMAQIGTMAAWGFPPRYLGYNELSAWFAQAGGAVLLLLLARAVGSDRERSRISALGPWAAVGLILTLLFFAKVTAAVVFAVFVLAVIIIARRPIGAAARALSVVAGAVGSMLVLLAFGVPVGDYIVRIAALTLDPSMQAESGYSLGSLVIPYLSSVMLTAQHLVVVTILLVVVLVAVWHGLQPTVALQSEADRSRSQLLRRAAIIAAVLLAIAIVAPQTVSVWDGLGIDIALLLVTAVVGLVVIGPSAFALEGRSPHRRAVVALGILVLVATPFMNAVGTLNPIVGQTVFSASLWATSAGVVLALLWEGSAAHGVLRLVPAGIAIVLVANGAVWVAADTFQHPYQTDPYFSQKTSVTLPAFAGLRVSESDASLLEWLADTAERENAADVPTTVIANSGALLAFNNSNWASPWEGAFSGPSLTRTCLADPPRELLLLQPASETPGTGPYDSVVSGLAGCGITFPDDFTEVAEHDDDDPKNHVTLWRYEHEG